MSRLEGQTLAGRYRIEEWIGGGGMADVYKAWDTERSCFLAIKVLRPGLGELDELQERLRREGEALSRLQHPNIVRLYGFEHEEDLSYLVMDYVDGPSLASRLKEAGGPLPMGEVVGLTEDVCSALAFAHRQGIYHRDIKPSNILVARDGRAILSDFGIARLTDAVPITYQGIGTPAYMSPEQCGEAEADARSDVYSFGVVLYETLTGRRPFLGDLGRGATPSTGNLIEEHLHHAPPLPSRVNPDLPAAMEEVLLRALVKAPDGRYQTASELAQAVRVAAGGTWLPSLRVTSVPSGASVYVDGQLRGTSPLDVTELAHGRHQLRIEAPGFEEQQQTVQVPEYRNVHIRLEPVGPSGETTRPLTPAVGRGALGPPRRRAAVGGLGWRDLWRKPWFKFVLGAGVGGIAIGVLILLYSMSGPTDDGTPVPPSSTRTPTATATRTVSPTASATRTMTPTATPTRTATPKATPSATASPRPTATATPPTASPTAEGTQVTEQPGKTVTYTTYPGVDPATGISVTYETVTGVDEGEGVLEIEARYPGGSLARPSLEVYSQKEDVDGKPLFGDWKWSPSIPSDGTAAQTMKAGTYAIKFPLGYEGPWNWGYEVRAGEKTHVLVIVSWLSITVRRADDTLVRPWVDVYKQRYDVDNQPIRGDRQTGGGIGETGIIYFELTPGRYVLDVDVKGYDWGSLNNEAKPGTGSAIELELGRLQYEITGEWVQVYRQETDVDGAPILGDDVEGKNPDNAYGAAVFDLTPGVYAVKAGDSTVFGVEIRPGETTVLP
jgi:serine/threonine protein kinase